MASANHTRAWVPPSDLASRHASLHMPREVPAVPASSTSTAIFCLRVRAWPCRFLQHLRLRRHAGADDAPVCCLWCPRVADLNRRPVIDWQGSYISFIGRLCFDWLPDQSWCLAGAFSNRRPVTAWQGSCTRRAYSFRVASHSKCTPTSYHLEHSQSRLRSSSPSFSTPSPLPLQTPKNFIRHIQHLSLLIIFFFPTRLTRATTAPSLHTQCAS